MTHKAILESPGDDDSTNYLDDGDWLTIIKSKFEDEDVKYDPSEGGRYFWNSGGFWQEVDDEDQ